ncbi:MAG TPA: hypothetical protein VM925_02965 [Labilithrix sp.]|nr:hypothetical protein [Labilithrix sp.]
MKPESRFDALRASALQPRARGMRSVGGFAALIALAVLLGACPRSPRTTARPDAGVGVASADAAGALGPSAANDAAPFDASVDAPATRPIGPYEVPFDKKRTAYYVAARSTARPARLLANLHGVCNPPGYACGYWVEAAASVGFLVCPSGNSTCGANGPPTWTESFPQMDADLERAITAVEARHPGEFGREGSILTGFSLGATAAYQIARAHPGRWPYLVLVEANVPLDKAQLEKAGVRAVALVAGEIGSQVAGERKTSERLAREGYPARLWVMKGAGHHYSADIDAIMAEAIAFVLGH